MAKLNWTEQATNDLISIGHYIERDSFNYAKIQIKRIRTKARILRKFPLSGRIVPELDNDFIRELILGNYRIIYKIISKDRIDILTIHHSAQLLDNTKIN
jgi:addiction module RelE/StbE family toxin